MRIAIYSDVHGNLTALQTVLGDIKKQAPDLIAFAGDLCLMGARPKACLELARAETNILVYGNTDEYIHTPQQTPEDADEAQRQRWEMFNELAAWTKSQLGSENVGWLERLPFSQRLSPTACPREGVETVSQDDLLIVHANPKDVNAPIFPPADLQKEVLGEVKMAQTDDEIRPLLENISAGIIAYGHVHFPNVRRWGEMILANISSVNLPGDGDARAKYGLLTWDKANGWTVEKRLVAYNLRQEREMISFIRPPGWEGLLGQMPK